MTDNHHQPPPGAEVTTPGAYDFLLNPATLAAWTADRQRQHLDDATVYGGVHATFQAALRAEHVEGDRLWAGRRRARKVEKRSRRLARAARAQAKAAEDLRTAYAEHRATVEALPAQRQAKKDAKAARRGSTRDRITEATTRSLGASAQAQAFAPQDTPPAFSANTAGQQAGGQLRGIADAWKKGA